MEQSVKKKNKKTKIKKIKLETARVLA